MGKVLLGVKAESIFGLRHRTKADPFVIKTEAQLRAFAASTTGDNAVDYAGQYVALDADITLNGAWTPIHYFAGNFDGRNHTVSGVRIGTELAPLEQKSVGFFDVLANGATLSNLNLTNVAVYGKITADYERPFVGGLVGGNLGMGKNARIDHCSVVGGIVSTEGKQWAYGGGLTASLYLDAYLTNSWTDVTVQVKSTEGLWLGRRPRCHELQRQYDRQLRRPRRRDGHFGLYDLFQGKRLRRRSRRPGDRSVPQLLRSRQCCTDDGHHAG